MNGDRWQRVKQLLDEAIALDSNERSTFLRRACGADQDLHREIESLLSSHDKAGTGFLKSPAVDLRPAAHASLSRTGRVGVYEIIEEIGRGGMGEVYRAVRADGQYTKEVALKMVRGGFYAASVLERFRNERQILATLDHSNIAKLLDGGTTEDGVPYLVMELIEGTPVDQYCDDHNLNVTERLELFQEVCGAVQYAHQRLVIHRDIKPSNILVTGDGQPKLLDFGIAKILAPGLGDGSATVERPMTPHYASPEQVRGDSITTASDVYSLGVVLYRLLTGRSPYPGETTSSHDLARAVCDTDPSRPSTAFLKPGAAHDGPAGEKVGAEEISKVREGSPAKLRRRLAGDLDNIVLMALRKEPQRRYLSVEQFAEDIRRHLERLPVTATKGSWRYRAGKFVARHKAGVGATAAACLALAIGIGATVHEARIANANRQRAEARFNDVRELANSFLFEFDEAIKNLPGSTPARALVVRRALEYLDKLAAEARGDRSLQLEIAQAYQKVAEVQGDPTFPNLGDSKGALQSSLKSQAILETLAREEPDNQQVRMLLAGAHQQISNVLSFTSDAVGAVEHSGQSLKIYEGLAESMSRDPAFQVERVVQTYHYANLLGMVGRLEEAVAEYRKAVELSQRLVEAAPSDAEPKVHLSASLDGLGNVLQAKGDTAGALENRRKGLSIRAELTRLDPDNAHYRRQLAFSHHNVGLSLVEEGDLASALANFQTELSLFESLSAADPKDVQGRRNRSLAHKQIGDVLMRTGDLRQALAHYRAALDIDRDLLSVEPGSFQAALDLSFSESKVGSALGKLGQTQEALDMLRHGVARQEALMTTKEEHTLLYSHIANGYMLLANFLLDRADTKGAVEYYRKAVAARLTLAEKSPNNSANRGSLAACYASLAKALGQHDRADALKQYGDAIELLEHLTTADRSNVQYRVALADDLSDAARLYVQIARQDVQTSSRLQDWTKAKSFYQRGQELWLELDRAGKLPPSRKQAVQEVGGELAQCNDSLAKLRQAPGQ